MVLVFNHLLVIEIEGTSLSKNPSTTGSPIAFKSSPAFLHTKPLPKAPKNYSKEFKLLMVPSGVKKKMATKEMIDDSQISNGNQDNSIVEYSQSKEEIMALSKSQNFEILKVSSRLDNDMFSDVCMNPSTTTIVSKRASPRYKPEEELEEQNEGTRSFSLKKSRANLLSNNQQELIREKSIKSQKLASPVQGLKSKMLKQTLANEGRTVINIFFS